MEDSKAPMLLIILAGLVVAFVIWKRSKSVDAASAVAPGSPGFGAALTGGSETAPPIPLQAPVMRGGPPTSGSTRTSVPAATAAKMTTTVLKARAATIGVNA